MNPSYIITDNSITIVVGGKPFTMQSNHASFNEVKDRIRNQDFDGIEDLFDAGKVIAQFAVGEVTVVGNSVLYKGVPVHNYVVDKILQHIKEQLPSEYLLNFLQKLMQNPSKRAVDELYGFLEAGKLTICEDGDFLAYRKVTSDYKDFYTGKFDNSVGAICEVPRNTVDEDKDRTCSYGLHFCSHSYLPHYHGGSGRTVVVKINPRDVVAIPADYNNAKGRCCRYEVVGDVQGRNPLPHREVYTPQDVVNRSHWSLDDDDEEPPPPPPPPAPKEMVKPPPAPTSNVDADIALAKRKNNWKKKKRSRKRLKRNV